MFILLVSGGPGIGPGRWLWVREWIYEWIESLPSGTLTTCIPGIHVVWSLALEDSPQWPVMSIPQSKLQPSLPTRRSHLSQKFPGPSLTCWAPSDASTCSAGHWAGLEIVSHSVMSDSLQPHELQSTRLLCPWDSPGKNTGVGCYFLL